MFASALPKEQSLSYSLAFLSHLEHFVAFVAFCGAFTGNFANVNTT
jgi:hypothetical protein